MAEKEKLEEIKKHIGLHKAIDEYKEKIRQEAAEKYFRKEHG